MAVVHCLSVQDVVGLWSERDALMMVMMMMMMVVVVVVVVKWS